LQHLGVLHGGPMTRRLRIRNENLSFGAVEGHQSDGVTSTASARPKKLEQNDQILHRKRANC